MKVTLQPHDQDGQIIIETLMVKPRENTFEQALLGMRIPQEIINGMTIIVEFRDIIPEGAMQRLDVNKFKIYLRNLRGKHSLNETVAHELKHIAIEVLKPKESRTDGKKSGSYKWEEVNCIRAEKRWGKLNYFEALTTGENA